MKVFSNVHANNSIRIADTVIKFTGNSADIPEELYKKIQELRYPHISAELPGEVKTKTAEDYNKDLKKINQEYATEIERLKHIIKSKDLNIADLMNDNKNWKDQYLKDTTELKRKLEALSVNQPSVVKEEKEPAEGKKEMVEDANLRKELEAMTVAELEKLAEEQEIPAESVKKAKLKADLINLIMKSCSEIE